MLKILIKRPLTVLTLFVLLTLVGGFMATTLPVDLFPEMDVPVIFARTTYSGAGAEEVEEELTDVLEEQFFTIEGLDSLASTSAEGVSSILMTFDWGSDIASAKDDARDKLDLVSQLLPDGADDTILIEFDPNDSPILTYSIQGDRTIEDLYDLAEELVQPQLEQVGNVSNVDITGGRDKIISVSVAADRLSAFGLSLESVAGALAMQNKSMGAGSVKTEKNEITVRTSGSFADLDQIRNTMITAISSNGEQYKIYIRDIAEVAFDTEDETSRVTMNSLPSVQIEVYKRTGSNTVEVAGATKAAVEELESDLPDGISIATLSDESTVIGESLSSVINSALIGILAAVVILMIFLRQIKSTLIIAITIPVSILITIMGMSLGNMTFNLVALTGLTLGVGMIVDNSIVIIENIFTHRERGERLSAAGLFGTQEMITAITASTLTTVSVFVPVVLFWNDLGMFGDIFGNMAFTVIVALLSSLLVAVLLVPVLATHYLEIHVRSERPVKNRYLKALDSGIEGAINWLTGIYHRLLSAALKRKLLTVLAFLLILIVSLAQIPKLGLSLQPEGMSESVVLNMELPLGSSLDSTEVTLARFKSLLDETENAYEGISMTAGANDTSYQGSITIVLPSLAERTMNADELKEELRGYFEFFPEVKFTFGGRMGPMASGDVNIKIQGDNLEDLTEYAEEAMELIEERIDGLVEITQDMETGLPQWDIVIDREKAFDLGLTISEVAAEINRQINGTTATSYTDENGDTYDIVVRLKEEDRKLISDLENINLFSTTGERIPVSSIAQVVVNTGPTSISREDKIRTVTLSGDLAFGARANFVETEIQSLLAEELPPPPGISLDYSGEMENIQETGTVLLKILVIAILLVFGVMVSQFESLRAPFIIILAMPMLAIGVIGIFLATGTSFDMIALIGIVMLAGMVVNNGIVLVDYISLLRKRGSSLYDACLNGGVSRLRPILMTTLTTISTMVPLAFFAGEGGAQMRGLALTVVGGLTVNTMITLVFVPVLYAIFYRKAETKLEINA